MNRHGGVDVGAKAEIYGILKELAQQGVSMIVVSSELPELNTLTGQLKGELARADYSEEQILKLAYGQQDTDERKRA